MTDVLLVILLVTVGSAVVLTLLGMSFSRKSGLPGHAEIAYEDVSKERVAKPLVSRTYNLTGKPDYILHIRRPGAEKKSLVPVEAKPSRESTRLQSSDRLQLAAYLLLVEDCYGTTPLYGLVIYKNQTHKVPWTRELRQELMDALDGMENALRAGTVTLKSHNQGKCRRCTIRTACLGNAN